MRRRHLAVVLLCSLACAMQGLCESPQSPLQITYGAKGLETLKYSGTVLEDVNASPSDAFHIGHMKMANADGHVLKGGQYEWGENNNGRSWDGATHTWNYRFSWGSIAVHYIQTGTNLDIVTTLTNLPGSKVIVDGAAVFPLVLHFAKLPAGFGARNYTHFAFNTGGPSVTVADFGAGEAVAVVPDAKKPLYSGFTPVAGPGFAFATVVSGTAPDSLPSFQPHVERPVLPGQTDSYTVSLRFAPSGTSTARLCTDVYKRWGAAYPPQLHWTDRRAIGTVYLASSPSGDPRKPGGYPTNPRRFFNSADLNVTNPEGLANFQRVLLERAAAIVANAHRLDAQGVITWDIEGEQYPQTTSYVCAPDEIARIAPEMESAISDPTSPYKGMKLDDGYFKMIRTAGLRVGVCLRPQHFTSLKDGTAQQNPLPLQLVAAELIRKAKYAHDRWGATLFYVDSTVEANGAVLDASIFQQVQAAMPDSLFIPEESTLLDYAYTAPFKSFLDLGAVGTDAEVQYFYPHAFSAVLVNDVDARKLEAAQAQLVMQVRRGDVLMTHVDYWQSNNPTVVEIYQAAKVRSPAKSHAAAR